MSQNKINLGTVQTSDVDLTSSVQIATITNSTSYDRSVSFRAQIGDGTKNLNAASGTTLTFITEVAGVQGEAIEAVTTSGNKFLSQNFSMAVRAGETYKLYCESDDANDDDVGVIVYPVDEGQMSPVTAGAQPAIDANGVIDSNLELYKGTAPADLADTDKIAVSVQHMGSDVLGADNIEDDAFSSEHFATSVTTEIAEGIESALVNDGDSTAFLQSVADKIASDLTSGDVTAQAIASASRDAILDRVLSGNHDLADSFGLLLQQIHTKTDELTFTTENKLDVRVDAVGATGVSSPDDLKADVSNLSTFDHTTDEVITNAASRTASQADTSDLLDQINYCLTVLSGSIANSDNPTETFVLTTSGSTYTVSITGLDEDGNRSGQTLGKV